jgi:phasin family protein
MPANHNNTERINQTAESRRNTADETVRPHRGASIARDTFQSGVQAAVESVQSATDHLIQEFGLCGARAEELVRRSIQNGEAVSQASMVLAKGAQEISQEWFDLARDRLVNNLDALVRLSSCRSLQDFTEVQSDVLWARLSQAVESSRRIAEVSVRAAEEAATIIQAQTKHNAKELERNAQSIRQAA